MDILKLEEKLQELKQTFQDFEEVLQDEISLLDKMKNILQNQILEVASFNQMTRSLADLSKEEIHSLAPSLFGKLKVIEKMTTEVTEIKKILI